MNTIKRLERYTVIPFLVIIFSYFLAISLKELQANEPPQVIVECTERLAFVKIENGVITTKPEKVCLLIWGDKEYIEKKHKML